MNTTDLAISLEVNQTPQKAFKAINNVAEWWTEIEGQSKKLDDVFTVRFGAVFITHKVVDLVPYKKVAWLVTGSSEKNWIDTKICFDISVAGDSTKLKFTHLGMVPELKDYDDCLKGWTKFVKENLPRLIAKTTVTMDEIFERFKALAAAERWFDLQDDLFASNVKSIDPPQSPYMGFAEGKAAVRKKGKDFVAKVEEFHGAKTSEPVIGGNYIAVGRDMDITAQGFGRIQINEIMLYEVKDGEVVSEQFFY